MLLEKLCQETCSIWCCHKPWICKKRSHCEVQWSKVQWNDMVLLQRTECKRMRYAQGRWVNHVGEGFIIWAFITWEPAGSKLWREAEIAVRWKISTNDTTILKLVPTQIFPCFASTSLIRSRSRYVSLSCCPLGAHPANRQTQWESTGDWTANLTTSTRFHKVDEKTLENWSRYLEIGIWQS